MKTNTKNKWSFTENECKKNGRKFGVIIEKNNDVVKVLVTKKNHECYNEIVEFQIIANVKN